MATHQTDHFRQILSAAKKLRWLSLEKTPVQSFFALRYVVAEQIHTPCLSPIVIDCGEINNAFAHLSHLTHLVLRGHEIECEFIQALPLELLPLVYLDISCKFDRRQSRCKLGIGRCTTLQELLVEDFWGSDSGAHWRFVDITGLDSLKKLKLCNNNFQKEAWHNVVPMPEPWRFPELRTLDISQTEATTAGGAETLKPLTSCDLQNMPKLVCFIANNRLFPFEELVALQLQQLPSLKKVYLRGAALTPDQCASLAGAQLEVILESLDTSLAN